MFIRINNWININLFLILVIMFALAFATLVVTCFMIVGASGVESGVYYNHLEGVALICI